VADYPHPSSPGRSANMRANRRTDTKPEMALRRALHGQGFRYRKDYRLDLEGARVRPDIAFTARRVAVFVDGCFWHACPEHGTKPASNTWYWGPKLIRNVERDRAADAALLAAGWQVVRVWEHEPLDEAVAAVVAALTPTTAQSAAAAQGAEAAQDAATAQGAAAAQDGEAAQDAEAAQRTAAAAAAAAALADSPLAAPPGGRDPAGPAIPAPRAGSPRAALDDHGVEDLGMRPNG
jgi:DNA mismatch endonuclease, patch repair protein